MKDQHTKIKGYRDLSQEEIDLMNQIKEHGEAAKKLLADIEIIQLYNKSLSELQQRNSYVAIKNARYNLQTGQMWLVRAVALPESF